MSIIEKWKLMCKKWQGDYVIFPGSRMLYEDRQFIVNRYYFASKFVSNKRVLEIGCNVGQGADYLARKGATRVTGIEISSEAVSYASTHYKGKDNLEFILLDANSSRLPFGDECFDVIVALEVLEHLKNPETLIHECARLLNKRDGLLILSTPNGSVSFVKARQHEHEFTISELQQLLNTEFNSIEFYTDGFATNYTNHFDRNRIRLVRLIRQIGTRSLEIVPKGNEIKWAIAQSFFHMTTVVEKQTISDDDVDKRFEILPLEDRKFIGEPIRLFAVVHR